MYIKKVLIENVKCFEQLDFSFDNSDNNFNGWTVITGDNASGKTALLKTLALCLVGPSTSHSLQPSYKGWIYNNKSYGTVRIQIVPGDKDRFSAGKRYENPFWSEITFERDKKNNIILNPKQTKGKKGPTRGPWLDNTDGWFCAGYGPFRRLYGHSPEAQRLMSTQGKVSRFATLFREDATLAEGDLWLKDLNHRELEENEEAATTLKNVIGILNSNLLRHSIKILRVDSDGLWLTQSDGLELSLENMSDGYRSIIALIVDIIRQIYIIYGNDAISVNDEKIYANCSGIVLIDEIDAHLHPAWQREIGEWLKNVFPNLQFIVTSHSPHICQCADENSIFHLTPPGDSRPPFQISNEDYKKIIAGKPNEILLSPAFGLEHTRSTKAVKSRLRYAKLQAKKKASNLSPSEQSELQQLSLFAESDVNNEKD